MSNNGKFLVEDEDIVKLDAPGSGMSRTGWVNVGPYAIRIEVSDSGKLIIEAMARAPAEHVVLAGCTVELVHCIEAGGSDPDQHNHSTLATAESTGGGPEFMTPPWSAAHARAALTEGWNIFESEGSAYGPWQIQRLDWAEETPGAKQLEDDESAWNIVLTGTAAHHAAALAFIRAHNPMDYETMMVHAERNGHQVPGLSL